jgi:hypothetical protein
VLSPEGSSAMCVQRFDGSRNSAIHTTYRISLRSSSLHEPSYPLLRVVFGYFRLFSEEKQTFYFRQLRFGLDKVVVGQPFREQAPDTSRFRLRLPRTLLSEATSGSTKTVLGGFDRFNDPSAGSPTETLLRLLLPLGGRVQRNSQHTIELPHPYIDPNASPAHPIGRSDGRCVQRAGT